MSKQITVRLPDDMVDFIDHMVAEERGGSRAAIVSKAIERERRRERAVRDARILADSSGDELDGLSQYAAVLPIDVA